MRIRFTSLGLLAIAATAAAAHGTQHTNLRMPPIPRVNPAQVRMNDSDWRQASAIIQADKSIEVQMAKMTTHQTREFILKHGDSDKKEIALTFDDGPHPGYTEKILDTLKQEHVPATFFVIGFMADAHPELVRAISNSGNVVGNHTYSHVTLTHLDEAQTLAEYKANNAVIERITGKHVDYCRPPGGDFNPTVLKSAAELGLTTVMWTDDPGDYVNPPDDLLFEREVDKLSNGGIVLLHDGSKSTLDTLQKFIRTAKAKGYRFVTLDELKRDRD